MNFIALAIIYQYGATPLEDFEVQEIPDESGELSPVITMWNLPDPQPTLQELDAYIASPAFAAARLAEAKTNAIEQVSQLAEIARSKVITVKPGKIGEYVQKENEVKHWIDSGQKAIPLTFDQDDYPIAKSEAEAYGIDTAEMLQIWEAKINEWAIVSAHIAMTERAAILAIEAATTIEQVEMVLAGVEF